MTAAPVRVAVVGAGWAGREIWLPRLLSHPAYQVVAAVDPALPDLGGLHVLAGHGELVPADVDLAVVAVPNHLHAPVACDLLRRGIDVFVEKPVCLSSAEAALLADAERSAGAMLLAGSATRHRSDMMALYREGATLGEIRHVDLSWVRARGVPGTDGWFTNRELSGGGALVDLGWHLLDAVRPLLADPGISHVTGTVSGDFVNRRASRAAWRAGSGEPAAGDVEDTARGFLVTTGGVSLGLRVSWASHEALDVTEIRVEGSAGTATLRCTFGFSPNREGGSRLTRTVDGVTVGRAVGEEIGAEYGRQLDGLPALLADRAGRGDSIAEAARTIGVIERFYAAARPAAAAGTPGRNGSRPTGELARTGRPR